VVWDFLSGALSLEKGAISWLSLVLVLLSELFYLSKAKVLGGHCVPMVG
jgi:hypothetical protein